MSQATASASYIASDTQSDERTAPAILVVEDDRAIAEMLQALLEGAGYRVTLAADGASAEEVLRHEQPDLILLDIMLPDTDGLVFCSELRTRSTTPVVLLSGTPRQSDRILGLRLGADDFIAKPFDTHELLARIDAVLRRCLIARAESSTELSALRIGPLTVDIGRRQVLYGEKPIRLTPTEFRLLSTLASKPDRVFSREELTDQVWGYVAGGESRVVDVHIRRLRQKLDEAQVADPVIITLRGFGYRLSRAGQF